MEKRTLKPEIAMYLRRIGDLRGMKKHGRAIQLCDKALGHEPDPRLRNVILNFKADSLYRVGRITGQQFMIDQAKECYASIIESDPDDYIAQKGLQTINFYCYDI